MDKIAYTARCHCGKNQFSFRAPKITGGMRCNCSICIRKGAVMSKQYIPAEDFTPIPDMQHLSDYRWNDKMVNHLFCTTCGIYPYHGDEKIGYRVNLGCVEDLDVLSLEITVYDGQAMPLAEET